MSGSIAFLFPGQGSQTVGMLEGFTANTTVEAVMGRASVALGMDLAELIAKGPAETLGLTIHTQPVMLACGVAFLRPIAPLVAACPPSLPAIALANMRP